MLHAIVIALFVMFSAALIGKILRHYFPDSGIYFSRDDDGEADIDISNITR